jgi:hypothetical protein
MVARSSRRSGCCHHCAHYIRSGAPLQLVAQRLGCSWRDADESRRTNAPNLDELGYLPFSASGGALLFHLLSKLCRRLQASLTRQHVTISEKVVQRLMKQESLLVAKAKAAQVAIAAMVRLKEVGHGWPHRMALVANRCASPIGRTSYMQDPTVQRALAGHTAP